MTTVERVIDPETGVIVDLLQPAEAMELTSRIKGHVAKAWVLLSEAHERKAHLAMGYGTWAEYVETEFEMSRSYSYRLLDLASVIRELESGLIAASWSITDGVVSPMGDINERQGRALSPLKGQPDEMAAAYIEATVVAEDEGRPVTSADIKEAVDTRTPAIKAMHERKAREQAERDQAAAGPTVADVIDKVTEAFEDNHPNLALRSDFGKAMGKVHAHIAKFDLRAVANAFAHGDELDQERPADFAADLRRWAEGLDPKRTLRSV